MDPSGWTEQGFCSAGVGPYGTRSQPFTAWQASPNSGSPVPSAQRVVPSPPSPEASGCSDDGLEQSQARSETPSGWSPAPSPLQFVRGATPESSASPISGGMQELRAGLSQAGPVGEDPEVEAHQELFLFERAAGRATKVTQWTNPRPTAGQPTSVTASIVKAPASFHNPCKMKKAFRPPFMVRVAATCTGRMSMECRASCYLLTKQQVGNIGTWHPDVHGPEVMVEGHVLECLFNTDGPEQDIFQEIEFTDLKFVQPTRMSKRFMLFYLEISTGVVLWLLYTLPTVVVSRSVDQYNKAILILKDIQPMDGRSLRGKANAAASAAAATDAAVKALKRRSPNVSEDGDAAGYYTPSVMRDYVLAKFREAGFQRALLESDITYLQLLAGFVGYAGVLGEGDTISPNQHLAENRWEAFSKWFESVVVPAIKSIQHLWDRTSPYAICPLSTTRELTESFLSKAPMGSFCVRPRLKAGAPASWVISCCDMKQGAPIQHILLSQEHLEMHSLEVWVRDLRHLRFCLDIHNRRLVHKEELFLNGYLRMDKSHQVSESMRTQISSQPSMVAQQQIGNPPMMSIPEKTLQAIYPYHQAASTGTDVLDINSLKLELDNAVPHW